ncbi:putative pentatricopeptide repeat-containing protein At3g05240 isoform X1 [Primulina tabacum]|uniref:putative pentatricopeptide repeat-containing protein At3g05240 isoform X1 n=1 Tax=Primulina tabacum TaxID=48773 RepID=UPI003F597B13
MTSSIRLQRFSQSLLKETTPNLFSSPQLLLNFRSHYPSTPFYSTSRILHNQDPKNTAVQWNLTIRDASATNPLKALSLFQQMLENTVESTPIYIDPFIYASLIKACNKAQAFLEGKSVHGHIIRLGLDYNVNTLNSLVCFYSGSVNFLSYAAVLFDSVVEKSVVAVNCMISGHVRRGNLDLGLSLFVKILRGCFGSNVKPNYLSFLILIAGCVEFGGRKNGTALHCCCSKMGFDCNVEICNVLIDFYAKFGCIVDAATVFRDSPQKDLISWNTMIWGYANNGHSVEALTLFKELRNTNIGVDRVSFSCLISSCAAQKDLNSGRMMHALAKAVGIECDISVGTALINMYAKCRKLACAMELFDDLPKQNIESWNTMMHAYVENGLAMEALKLFDHIKHRNLELDEVTVLGLIMACRDLGNLNHGIYIHSFLLSKDLLRDNTCLGNALIDMYAKCGSMTQAKAVFDHMINKDVISWTSLISGYAINGESEKSLDTFKHMCDRKIAPNFVTFIGVLSACDHAGLVHDGRNLYGTMKHVYGIEPQIEHYGCLINMLARAGRIDEARKFIGEIALEPNAVVWRMLINACSVYGNINLGLNLVSSMTEPNTSHDSGDCVISSNIFAVAGRWADVISQRNLMFKQRSPKVAGKSSLSCLTE